MNDNPYTPPRVEVADIEHAMPTRPRVVTIAVSLLWVSAACSLPSLAFELSEIPLGVSVLQTVLVGLIGLLAAFAISWFLNGAAWKGRNWSRWALGILTAVSTLALILILSRLPRLNPDLMPRHVVAQYVAQTVMNIIAVAMLCSPGANAWFRAMTAARSRAI